MHATSLTFKAKNAVLVVKEVISVALIALEKKKEGRKEVLIRFRFQAKEVKGIIASSKSGQAAAHFGIDTIATSSVVEAGFMLLRKPLHLSTITNTSSAPREKTIWAKNIVSIRARR